VHSLCLPKKGFGCAKKGEWYLFERGLAVCLNRKELVSLFCAEVKKPLTFIRSQRSLLGEGVGWRG
jgi:hypothetical protein